MKVYLDNNILVDIEEGKYAIESFVSKGDSYYYSDAHIDELINGIDKYPELKDKRLQTIQLLCGSNYIVSDIAFFKMEFENKTPQSAFELCMTWRHLHDYLNEITDSMKVDRDVFTNELKLKKQEVNNYNPSEIFKVLEKKMTENWGYGIETYLKKAAASTGRTVFSSLFNLLDFMCFWHDKSSIARLYDSSHAYYGKLCDIIVSNDKRMRYKTMAVYDYLGISTSVMTADEFLNPQSSILNKLKDE